MATNTKDTVKAEKQAASAGKKRGGPRKKVASGKKPAVAKMPGAKQKKQAATAPLSVQNQGVLETIGFATGKTVGKLTSMTRVIKGAAGKVLASAKKRVSKS